MYLMILRLSTATVETTTSDSLSAAHFITASQIVDVRDGELSAAMYRVTMVNERVIIKFSVVLMSCQFACSLLYVELHGIFIYCTLSKADLPDVLACLHTETTTVGLLTNFVTVYKRHIPRDDCVYSRLVKS